MYRRLEFEGLNHFQFVNFLMVYIWKGNSPHAGLLHFVMKRQIPFTMHIKKKALTSFAPCWKPEIREQNLLFFLLQPPFHTILQQGFIFFQSTPISRVFYQARLIAGIHNIKMA